MTKTLVLLTLLFSYNAYSEQTTWKLVRQVAAPANWTCADEAVLNISGNALELTRAQNNQVRMPEINGDTVCQRLNSSYILGGVRCSRSTYTENEGTVVFKRHVCQKEGFWATKCNPMRNEAGSIVEVKDDTFMTVSEKTGSSLAPDFTCEYARK